MKYRLVPGNGLPLKGLAEYSISTRKKSPLLSSKLSKAAAVFGGLVAALAVYKLSRRSVSAEKVDMPDKESEEDSQTPTPATAVIPALPLDTSEPASPPEKTFKEYVDDVLSSITGKKTSTPDSKPPDSKPPTSKPATLRSSSVSAEEATARERSLLSRGSFSPAERAHIRELSASGITSSATIGRQMPPEVRSAIIREAELAGLDPEMMLRVASLESGGNPHAISATGAVGVFQFTSGTASDFNLSNRFDMVANVKAAMQLTNRSLGTLKKAGLGKKASSALSVYISHQIGATGAKEVLSKPRNTRISSLSKSTQRNIRVNIGGNSETVGQYLKANEDALSKKFDAQEASSEPSVPVTLASVSPAPARASSPLPGSPSPKTTPQPKTPNTRVASSTVPKQASSTPPDTSSFSPKDDKVASTSPSTDRLDDRASSPSSGSSDEPSKQIPSSLIRLESGILVGLG